MIFGRTAVTDANGNTTGYTVKSYGYYTYDAWGNVTAHTATGSTPASTSLIYRNPLRYRGYIYDNETGFYYLQSRYYDPANHRFINADSYTSTDSVDAISCNMFAYCNNNPVIYGDSEGTFLGGLIGAVVGAVVGAVSAAIDGRDILAGAAIGAATGAIAGLAVDAAVATGGVAGIAIATIGGAVTSGGESVLNDVANGDPINLTNAAISAVAGAVGGALSFGVAGGTLQKVGGNVAKNMAKNASNTVLKGAAKTVGKTAVKQATKYAAKRIVKNVASELAMTTVVSSGMWACAKKTSKAVQ